MTIGEKIHQLRMAKDMSVLDLGRKAGITDTTIYDYEKGKRKPTAKTVRKIANALGAKFEAFYDDRYTAEDDQDTELVKVKDELTPEKFNLTTDPDNPGLPKEAFDAIYNGIAGALCEAVGALAVQPPEGMSMAELTAWMAGYGTAINSVKEILKDEKDADNN